MTDFTALPDLAGRALGGTVVAANDESFCAADNIITPGDPAFNPKTFDQNGQVYDGWETRRRREPGHDWAVVRLGAPGVIRGVVVDTAFFTGNHPERCSIEGACFDGYPSEEEMSDVEWALLAGPVGLKGDARNAFAVNDSHRYSHIRLNVFPDGGVARLRVHGEVVADPSLMSLLPVDFAALTNGGRVVDCSDSFYSAPNNMLMPGLAQVTGDGWETRRRRDDGNDWALIGLAALGHIRLVELDTSRFKFNAPGWASLTGIATDGAEVTLLPKTRLQPDTLHRFQIADDLPPVSQVRVDIYPDGGLARLRVFGIISPEGLAALQSRWLTTHRPT